MLLVWNRCEMYLQNFTKGCHGNIQVSSKFLTLDKGNMVTFVKRLGGGGRYFRTIPKGPFLTVSFSSKEYKSYRQFSKVIVQYCSRFSFQMTTRRNKKVFFLPLHFVLKHCVYWIIGLDLPNVTNIGSMLHEITLQYTGIFFSPKILKIVILLGRFRKWCT